MDTRFWGPSGWKLLHLICEDYRYSAENAVRYAEFFETIPYILPCKFCRASLTDYYRLHPYQLANSHMSPTLDLSKWIYTVHNCVNDKLRKQGFCKKRNPPFSEVKRYYIALNRCEWDKQLLLFWDFLFAVGYHHPKEKVFYAKPMPNCPTEVYQCKDHCEKNKWNVLPSKERMKWFTRFWFLLPAVLPQKIAEKWKKMEYPPTLHTRSKTMDWLWRMRCGLDADFRDPYTSICKKVAMYSSDCGHSNKSITCRRKKTPMRKTKKRNRYSQRK